MIFTVRISRDAAKRLGRLDRPTQERIQARLQELGEDPCSPQIGKPLVKAAGRWSSRVGNTWRIVYQVDRAERIICVDAIQSRGQVYRRI